MYVLQWWLDWRTEGEGRQRKVSWASYFRIYWGHTLRVCKPSGTTRTSSHSQFCDRTQKPWRCICASARAHTHTHIHTHTHCKHSCCSLQTALSLIKLVYPMQIQTVVADVYESEVKSHNDNVHQRDTGSITRSNTSCNFHVTKIFVYGDLGWVDQESWDFCVMVYMSVSYARAGRRMIKLKK